MYRRFVVGLPHIWPIRFTVPMRSVCSGYLSRSMPTLMLLLLIVLPAVAQKAVRSRNATYCNPIDIAYRFALKPVSRREAADPTMVYFHKKYWLFPSKSGGYWRSSDLVRWEFIEIKGYPAENYAPTAFVYHDRMYMTSGGLPDLYSPKDLDAGEWEVSAHMGRRFDDPAIFVDDDGRVFVAHGTSDKQPLKITELDPRTGFTPLETVEVPQSSDPTHRGWEVPGNDNTMFTKKPFIEGAWLNKHDGTYYLQYAAPGTQYKSYADGVLTSSSPLGPYKAAKLNPFSFKPTGFVTGAGHSSTFAAADGRFWHVATMVVSVRAGFERRLGLFPASFTADGSLITDTYLGDYPHYIGGDRGLTGWMLLSRKKPVTASSSMANHPAEAAVDEDIRTWWSAESGKPDEWFRVDLGALDTVQAVQINFGDEGSTTLGRSTEVYRYILEASGDGRKWVKLVDHSRTGRDAPHDYEVLRKPVRARYVRIRNVFSPNNSKFSLSDLRVFGSSNVPLPHVVESARAVRDPHDSRHASISWKEASGAEFYIVRIGPAPGLQTMNYQVYDGNTSIDVHSLNSDTDYYVSVDSVNDSGITRGIASVKLK